WTVAKHLLKHERGGGASSPSLHRYVAMVREAAASVPSSFGGPVADDPVFQRDLGDVEAEIASLEHVEKLAISGHPISRDPAFPSMRKTMSSELTQRISVLMTRVAGLEGL